MKKFSKNKMTHVMVIISSHKKQLKVTKVHDLDIKLEIFPKLVSSFTLCLVAGLFAIRLSKFPQEPAVPCHELLIFMSYSWLMLFPSVLPSQTLGLRNKNIKDIG